MVSPERSIMALKILQHVAESVEATGEAGKENRFYLRNCPVGIR
jgi:hypothetical protein